ncbi:TonB-dependent siderophore receptor [Phenylobacterium sp.]|jgi:iron complex outermembrane receptor protein|uniref:TonB-dependent receptor n=1 Tax=Phenylobacterium sp. TaxID=1871053 RepID=UPI002E3362B9|nr:TonB-dependent siderophore receptor [Phenylobacterium sp.]HEX3367457.1 TonB-dependent siderophore receptor [Phenylobacterium sp.]
MTTVSLLALATALSSGAAAAADAADATTKVDEVIVTAQQQRKQVESSGAVGVLGTQDALSIPFNVTSFTSKLILDQQSETIGAVLENDPSVRVTYGSGNQSELYVIRGFVVNGDDVALDGLYGVLPRQLISPELFENVQVLNGASAFVYGAAPSGSIGGAIDLQPKRATGQLLRATASYIQDSIFGGAIDLGDRFGSDKEFGARFNSVYRTGTAAIHDEDREVAADSVDLDWRHGPVKAYFDLGYEQQHFGRPRPEIRLSPGVAVPSAPDPSDNYGQPWSFTSLRDVFGVGRVEFEVNKDLNFYAAFGARRGHEEGDYSTLTVTNATTGAATGSRLFVPRQDRNESGLVGVRWRFDLGPVTNAVNAGGSGVRLQNFNSFSFGSFPAAIAASSTSFFDNLYNTPQVARPTNSTLPSSGGSLTAPPLVARTVFASSFASDTLGILQDKVLLTVGVRDQDITVKSFSRATLAQTTEYDASKVTPIVGLIVKPLDNVSLYANRSEELVQGAVAPVNATTVNPGEVFAPYVVRQYEVGAKWVYHGLTATIAAYQMKLPSAFAIPVAGSNTLTQFGVFGEQENKGIELGLNGEPTDWLRLIGGLTFNDAKLTATANGTNNGKKVIGVPDYQANLGVEIIPPSLRGAVFTARWLSTGEQYLDVGNTQRAPSWNRFDIGARYVAVIDKHPVTFRASLENIANKAYWESAFGGYLVQGEPRTAKASITFEY